MEKNIVSKKLERSEKRCHNSVVVEMPRCAFAEQSGVEVAEPTLKVDTKWLWWGGDCEDCLAQGGLHDIKPEVEPPLHPNCDCVLEEIEADPEQAARLRAFLARGVRLVREINLMLKDKHLSDRQREVLEAARRELDWLMRDIVEERRMFDYFLVELEDALREVELKVSRVKFELSLREANEQAGEGGTLDADEWYSDKALDKADEMDELLRDAADKFGVSYRAVRAAFTDEYDQRDFWKDNLQDLVYKVKDFPITKEVSKFLISYDWRGDIGLSNVNKFTAKRLEKKYNIPIPEGMSVERYLTTDEGCAVFSAAAIKEAEENLESYKNNLPTEKKEILDRMNEEEKDALTVAIFKRGQEDVFKNLDNQLEIMTEKRSKQKYIHMFEGYKAWEYWNRGGEF